MADANTSIIPEGFDTNRPGLVGFSSTGKVVRVGARSCRRVHVLVVRDGVAYVSHNEIPGGVMSATQHLIRLERSAGPVPSWDSDLFGTGHGTSYHRYEG